MTGRDKIFDIMNYRNNSTCGFWKGHPHEEALAIYLADFNVKDEDELSILLGDDLKWKHAGGSYKHPDGCPMFDCYHGIKKVSHSQPGVFAETEDIKEIEKFPWPEVKHLNFDEYIDIARKTRENKMAFFGGFWACFFHDIADFFGMENYFIKMYTDPAVVEAVTEQVVGFYLQANKALFEKAADLIDVYFFGNDFGTQLDLFISPDMFRKFIYPSIIKLVDLAKSYDIKVALHSCGSIYRVLPLLIDAGVDILHPIQAKAANMDAIYLNKNYKDKIVFMGGLDTQDLLPFGTETQIKEEVKRLKDIFGPNYILSPSHEALLKNVSSNNVKAMADEVKK